MYAAKHRLGVPYHEENSPARNRSFLEDGAPDEEALSASKPSPSRKWIIVPHRLAERRSPISDILCPTGVSSTSLEDSVRNGLWIC